jgi:hypothetical protein
MRKKSVENAVRIANIQWQKLYNVIEKNNEALEDGAKVHLSKHGNMRAARHTATIASTSKT